MNRFLAAALLSAAVVIPAGAKDVRPYHSRTMHHQRVHVPSRPIESQSHAEGLPGVALAATDTTERPSGPGGLRNGVGAVGTLMPNSSSSNGQLLNDNGNGVGFPLDL